MRYGFYDSLEYKKKQAEKTKLSWDLGLHDSKRAKIEPRYRQLDPPLQKLQGLKPV